MKPMNHLGVMLKCNVKMYTIQNTAIPVGNFVLKANLFEKILEFHMPTNVSGETISQAQDSMLYGGEIITRPYLGPYALGPE